MMALLPLLASLLLLLLAPLASPHGNMLRPPTWWDRGGTNTHIGCGTLDLPDTEFSEVHDGR